MADASVNEFLVLINQQIEIQEALFEQLAKIEAVVQVGLNGDFIGYKPATIHTYLLALCSMIKEAKNVSQQAISYLLIAQSEEMIF